VFVLLDPIVPLAVPDRPYLGTAVLLRTLRRAGHRATVGLTQPDLVRALLVDSGEESHELIRSLSREQLARPELELAARSWRLLSREDHARALGELHARLLERTTFRDYLDPTLADALEHAFTTVWDLFDLALGEGRRSSLVDRLVDRVLSARPTVVGVCLYSGLDLLTRRLVEGIRARSPVPIVVGGPLTVHLAGAQVERLFAELPVDYLLAGLAHPWIAALAESIDDRGRGLEGIPNLVYRSGSSLTATAIARCPGSDADQLPAPDYSGHPLDRYLTPVPILPILGSTGCAWRGCAFCSHHQVYGDSFREYPVDEVVDLICELRDAHRCHHMTFHDEWLAPRRITAIAERLLERGVEDVAFDCYARFMGGFTPAAVAVMRRAGFCSFHWGLESGSQGLLDRVGKGISVEVAEQTLRTCHEAAISNKVWIVHGLPTESADDLQQTFDFLDRNHRQISLVIPQPFSLQRGSLMAMRAEEYGLVTHELDGPGGWGTSLPFAYRNRDTRRRWQERFDQLSAEVFLGNVRVSASPLNCLPSSHAARMLHFVVSSFGLLDEEQAVQLAATPSDGDVFPLSLPDPQGGGFRRFSQEGWQVYRRAGRGRLPPLGALAGELLSLSDGSRSLRAISARLEGAAEAMEQLIRDGYVVCFARRLKH